MYLEHIKLSNFKNIDWAELEFSPKINCITGNNGMGKTNLLDAIYYLSMTKSYFHNSDLFSIKHTSEGASIVGDYKMDDDTISKIVLTLSNASNKTSGVDKVLKRNEKSYKRFSEHIGLIPIVMVSPFDTSLINSPAEERRRFIDQLISQVNREYLINLQNYNKLLLQRNKILKNEGDDTQIMGYLESVNHYLSKLATYIFSERNKMCQMLNNSLKEYYTILSGGSEIVNINYISHLQKDNLDSLFEKYYSRDRMYRFTTVGIHKDDLIFEMGYDKENFYPLRRCGSQGQQKCFIIALKFAQFSIMQQLKNQISPILLLDDIFDKLDMKRVEYLLSLVSNKQFGQIFITDSNKVRTNALIEKIGSECKDFYIEEGVVK